MRQRAGSYLLQGSQTVGKVETLQVLTIGKSAFAIDGNTLWQGECLDTCVTEYVIPQ
jgi:hypothetical protein